MSGPVAALTNIETVQGVYQTAFRLPAITAYNRLEASPRTTDFTRSLRAEVRDPMWMLTRQWQLGEFQGEDAATPIGARILSTQQHVDRVVLSSGPITAYDETLPVETRVEREALRSDLGLAVEIARAYRKLDAALVSGHQPALIGKYPLTFNPDPNDYAGSQLYESAQTRWWNGFAMFVDMTTPGANPALTRFREWLDGDGSINAGDKDALEALVAALTAWYARMYSQPATAENAWKTRQLEYGFTLATPPAQQNVLAADEYYQGHVDWYSFDLDNRQRVLNDGESVPTTPPDEGDLASFIPSPISFKGMPNPRFWQMEENQTDFGAIGVSTTGLLHLAFAEFGLIYSNDWFMLPFPMTFNSLCEVKGIVVIDVFGQETLIRAAGRSAGTSWHRWTMFENTDRAAAATGAQNTNKLYLASSITQFLESDPVERVNFLRDDAAKMVWGVENIVPSLAGPGIRGDELDIGMVPPNPFVSAGAALIRYVAGTTVPTNWIPFLPVHLAGSDSEIQLQRARLPGAPAARGRLLTEVPPPFFINEEEVPRAGVIVGRTWQRARWTDGQTYLWLGRWKEAGRGEGSSELKFDQLEEIKPPEPV
ncbi:MAG: hypothetical protein ABIT20_21715 [Gemmatimonadaceae bacterium]